MLKSYETTSFDFVFNLSWEMEIVHFLPSILHHIVEYFDD